MGRRKVCRSVIAPPPISPPSSPAVRPDLAAARLNRVTAPTLLIVGGQDTTVLQLNRAAALMLRCQHQVAVVPGATHLFEEPGTLQAAAERARDWFRLHMPIAQSSGHGQ